MHNHHSDSPVNEESLREGYETSDMQMKMVIILLGVVGAMMVGTGLVIVLLMRAQDLGSKSFEQISPTYTNYSRLPGVEGPLMENDPRAERDIYRAEAIQQINSYGMLSADAGMERAHIPIEEAMKQLAAGEVPYKQEPQAALVQ